MSAYHLGLASLCLTLSFLFVVWRRFSDTRGLPPGPTGHWFWGPQLSNKLVFLQYEKWTKQYGPVVWFKQGLRQYVVVGSHQAAMDILEKEGAVTADRPRFVVGSEILSGGMRTLLVGVGERLRKLRRALHSHLQARVVTTYEPMQLFNSKQLIRDILHEPSDHIEHAKRYAASVILSLTYGKPSPSHKSDSDVVLISQSLIRLGGAMRPGAYLVESFPILKHLPFYGRTLRRYHQDELDLFSRQLQGVRKNLEKGNAPPSFGQYLVQNQGDLALSNDELAYLAGAMFGAGSETTASAISSAIMAAAVHPDAERRVQEELDAVVGFDRLPSFSDWNDLPQVQAFFNEVFRWRPPTAIGAPHRATKDLVWNGYTIPKTATIIPNLWSVGRDPTIFPNGDLFTPQRWIDEKGALRTDISFPNFGFGRRICPGMHVANRSLFINTAMLLHSFHIKQDEDRPIDTLALREGLILLPLPFAVKFEPRHPGGVQALKALLNSGS